MYSIMPVNNNTNNSLIMTLAVNLNSLIMTLVLLLKQEMKMKID